MNDEPRLRVTAYAVVVRDAALLLTQLSEASPVFAPGLWTLPGGGLEPGEQPAEALVRELHEETGLEVVEAGLLDARSYLAERNGTRWNVVALLYGATTGPGEAKVVEAGGSTSEVRWVALDQVRELPLSAPAEDALRFVETVVA